MFFKTKKSDPTAPKATLPKKTAIMVTAASLVVAGGATFGIVVRPWTYFNAGGTTTTTTSSTTTTTSGGTDTYLTPPYSLMPDSVFNQNVTSWSLLSNSSTLVTNWQAMVTASGYAVGVNFNRPIFWIASGTANASLAWSGSGCGSASTFIGSTAGEAPSSVPIPTFAYAGPSSDGITVVYNASQEVEIWQAVKNSNTSWDGCYGGSTQGTTMAAFNGVIANNYGETATSIANLSTLITEADVNAALPDCPGTVSSGCVIHHAIGYDVFNGYCNSYVSPATRGDCGSKANYPSEGMYFRFSSTASCPTTSSPCNNAFADLIFNTIQTYGMVAIDQGGAVQLEAEDTSDWTANGETGTDPISTALNGQAEYSVVANLPWSSLQALSYP